MIFKFGNMRNLIIGALILFLLYSNSTFRSYTIRGLQSISDFIKELPTEEKIDKELEPEKETGFSTY
tara:strand:+ start:238 stop:438 length:201 start_codon:yes stop_codon:yes gene_type:complete